MSIDSIPLWPESFTRGVPPTLTKDTQVRFPRAPGLSALQALTGWQSQCPASSSNRHPGPAKVGSGDFSCVEFSLRETHLQRSVFKEFSLAQKQLPVKMHELLFKEFCLQWERGFPPFQPPTHPVFPFSEALQTLPSQTCSKALVSSAQSIQDSVSSSFTFQWHLVKTKAFSICQQFLWKKKCILLFSLPQISGRTLTDTFNLLK